ncbi:MAG: bifunctional phosphoglucose/phosphomannose isomerase [Candidatus Terrybacteria bacterium RIFCSPLOWO2_01_FULL_44_24]|uniref:Bifunctional phosphoglucose/phosphomannose isomerase n=1 Tax=Candidatus Terrybacteria bacterium RIFCSPHIGHO2_01_FULL_43_35 TaxID=1802361 RepID=A0A1G2PCV2_9BACT|nr:MAG: bifunctional phosphoglucose/phosphomannose isomerase [Candidatus Terrybacteria bacterium RIFCSPHIGHO2_01_FULL_43_35]OHA50446.1 MAG: bifunctional phosphoglucose/phosphomannose isomerase [Candidatus Terrybacteria bacterium RIFCSPHIGHO2_02_FULL_43_14]OHA51096.1 MAG: bifunctional phosphoglucose/phosphomannose isomerase [Candidatus Terrybacteria bacterium RIFCSPLOWO2_01_FULL_44_24]
MHNALEKIINDFSNQFAVGIETGRKTNFYGKRQAFKIVNSTIICGMGGSGLPGDILKSWQLEKNIVRKDIIIHKNYGLPKDIKKPLIICVSYSGNTEETLSAYKQATKSGLPVLSIASGGELALWSQKNKTPLVLMPKGIPPRFAIGYQFGALVGLLVETNLISKEIISIVLKDALKLKKSNLKKDAAKIVIKIGNRIPLIYSSERNKSLGYLLKIQFNENTKIPAFTNTFPEFNHNEFNAFDILSKKQNALAHNFCVLMLNDANDLPIIKKRMKISGKFIKKTGAGLIYINLRKSPFFLRTFAGLILGQWISVLLAQKYTLDPEPTELIEKFKKALA